MHLEQQYDGERGEDVDKLVVESQKEEFYAEVLFKVGSGVCRGTIARDYSDPLQAPNREYPITFSADSTTKIFKGLYKIMEGPDVGYLSVSAAAAKRTYESLMGVSDDLSFHGLKAFLAEEQA